MKSIRDRARERFPTVLLTLVSIVQAIALEFLWDHGRHLPGLFEPGWTALIAWLQIGITLQLIILIWLAYTGLILRLEWTPKTVDSVLPFLVGLVQFLMIELATPEYFAAWIFVYSFISAMVHLVSYRIMRRARQDPANSEFFDHISPATWRDIAVMLAPLAVAALIGPWFWITGTLGWPALVVLVIILIRTGYVTRFLAQTWDLSMGTREMPER